ncbi:unnamed protein product [Pylaiella littoralis]
MQQQADEDELGLSSAALAALKEFAVENNMLGREGDNNVDVRLKVQERMDVKERTHDFRFAFGDDGDDEQVFISLAGINPELGQTLASTGLTVWRAAQEMARFMWEHRQWFVGKRVVELGAGLGLCGVLASKLCTGGMVVITDGGEEFTDSAMDALRKNLERNSCKMPTTLPTSDGDEGAGAAGAAATTAAAAVAVENGRGAKVVLERLTWGEHANFLERYGGGGSGAVKVENKDEGGEERGGFDFIVTADVIYEEEGISPLLHTVVDILRLREGERVQEAADSGESTCCTHRQPSPIPPSLSLPPPPARSTFLLAFARRNISIERVLEEAESLGLSWTVPEDFEPASASENVYLMSLR